MYILLQIKDVDSWIQPIFNPIQQHKKELCEAIHIKRREIDKPYNENKIITAEPGNYFLIESVSVNFIHYIQDVLMKHSSYLNSF